MKVSLTQNIQRAIYRGHQRADHCGQIPLVSSIAVSHWSRKLIHLLSWAAVEETDEDEDKKFVLGDTLEELD